MRWFLHSCPFALLNSQAVSEVMDAWFWVEKSQLQVRYPAGIPVILANAIMSYDNGRNKGLLDYNERIKRRKNHS